MNHVNSFSKAEHLCGEIRINRLFTRGKSFITYPLRVVYIIEPGNNNEVISVLVSVPKKRFKRAVKRNRIKRLMRESYRQNKQSLVAILHEKGLNLQIAFNYVSDEELNFTAIDSKMKIALKKIEDLIL